jgi:hypothetical protein
MIALVLCSSIRRPLSVIHGWLTPTPTHVPLTVSHQCRLFRVTVRHEVANGLQLPEALLPTKSRDTSGIGSDDDRVAGKNTDAASAGPAISVPRRARAPLTAGSPTS